MPRVRHRLGGEGTEIKRDDELGVLVEWPDESRSWEDPRDISPTHVTSPPHASPDVASMR